VSECGRGYQTLKEEFSLKKFNKAKEGALPSTSFSSIVLQYLIIRD
jgi:hypothetical protein